MKPKEEATIAAGLVTAYPSLPLETAQFWARELSDVDFAVAMEAVRSMARAVRYPTLADLAERIEAAKAERRRLAEAERAQLGDGRSPMTEREREINRLRVGVICELVSQQARMAPHQIASESLAEAIRRYERIHTKEVT